ncbi:MAG: PDZ domain-containing protein [Kiritimatiellia bacterium]
MNRQTASRHPVSSTRISRCGTEISASSRVRAVGLRGLVGVGLLAAALTVSAESVRTNAAAGAPPPKEAPKPDARKLAEWHQQAMEFMKQKEYAKALEKYEELFQVQPSNVLVLYNSACALARIGDKTRALERLRKSVEGGFVNFGFISRDADLESLRTEAGYKDLFVRKEAYVGQARERAVKNLVESLARRKIDAKPYQSFYDAERNFVYLHAKTAPEFAQVRQGVEDFAECFWHSLIDRKPEQPLYVVLLTPKDAPKAMPMAGVGGYFQQDANTLFCCERPASQLLQASIVFHEFTHGLHWADQSVREQDHPIWIKEGLSTLFESSRQEDGRLIPLPSYRLSVVQQTVKAKRSIPWAAFTKLDNASFVRNANICYAQTRYMLYYLYAKGKLQAFYDDYTKEERYRLDKSGMQAFEVVFGKPAAAVEQDWKEWVLLQEAPHVSFLGVITEEKNERVVVKSVVPRSPAMAARIRKGDVIVAVEQTPVQYRDDLMEVVCHHKVGEEIVLQLERDGQVLEITAKLAERPETAPQPTDAVTEKSPDPGDDAGKTNETVRGR